VMNDTKVFPCRLPAKKPGGGRTEIFLLSEKELNLWEALVKGGASKGSLLHLDSGIVAEVAEETSSGTRIVRFLGTDDVRKIIDELGRTPLPPYIKREPSAADRERYQTVYAAKEGAVAAPTAGLHFTPRLIQKLAARGVECAAITLHVGPGTFQPVRTDRVTDHRMLPERYEIQEAAAEMINRAIAGGRRIIAVGTTSVRTLESAADSRTSIRPGSGSSDLFIHPGYDFKIANGMITNFHLPKSTLLMLVSAFAGRARILSAYREAVSQKYRFYSYGDAMLIL
jgi:S-adenosylmethionine:tRNA ribosyltransferase-isomerase